MVDELFGTSDDVGRWYSAAAAGTPRSMSPRISHASVTDIFVLLLVKTLVTTVARHSTPRDLAPCSTAGAATWRIQ